MLYLTTISCVSYTLSTLCQAQRLFSTPGSSSSYFFRLGSLVSLFSHGYLLYILIETPGGQNLHSLILLSLIFWLLNITIFLSVHLVKVENLALFAYPLTTLVLIVSLIYPGKDIIQTNAFSGMVSHIFLSLLATSTLCLAFFQAILLSVQNYYLKHRTPSAILKLLPPLQTMESLLFIFLWSGSVLLSLALISGLWFQYNHPALAHTPEILLSVFSWLIIVVLLIGRYKLGWRSQKAVIGTTLGFALIFISYFGTHI